MSRTYAHLARRSRQSIAAGRAAKRAHRTGRRRVTWLRSHLRNQTPRTAVVLAYRVSDARRN